MLKLVSIIVPVYNGAQYINRMHQQLLNQTYQNIEIIYINDGSKDESLKLLNQIAASDSNVKVITQNNSGPARTRNRGLEEVSGDYVMFVDIDDTIELDLVEQMYKKAIQEEADLVVCNYKDVLSTGECIRVNKTAALFDGTNIYDNPEILFIKPAVWNKLVSTRLIKEYQITFPETHIGEDLVFTIKNLMKAKKVVGIQSPLYHYVLHENTISRTYSDGILDLLNSLDYLYEYVKEEGLFEKFHEEINYIAIQNIIFQITKVPFVKKNKEEVYFNLVNYLKQIDGFKTNKYVSNSFVYSSLVRLFVHKIIIFNPISRWLLKQLNGTGFVYKLLRKLDK